MIILIKKLIYKIKPPCSKCPYRLGLVKTLVNPCPQCMNSNYQTYERFKNERDNK